MLNCPVLLLTTTGRKSGKQHTVPLLYLADGTNLVLVASNGGAAKHPAWWLNLQAHPDVKIEIMSKRIVVTAKNATPEEKQRLWPLVTTMYSGYSGYQAITDRDIPLVLLPIDQSGL